MHPERPKFVYAMDFIRMATILGVVLVHAIRFALVPQDAFLGGLMQMLFQFGRESFMVVTGFVLAYQYAAPKPGWPRFWLKRGRGVLIPYLFWLAVFVASSMPLWPLSPIVHRFWQVLPTGDGHLYYIVITLQFYLLAPLFMALIRGLKAHPIMGAAGAIGWELMTWTLSAAVHSPLWAPQLLASTYAGYFVLGGIVATQWGPLSKWLAQNRWLAQLCLSFSLPIVAVVYGVEFSANGVGVATNVFQPISVVYAVVVIWALFAAGTWYEERRLASPGFRAWVGSIAGASFGIYLIHPLYLHGWLSLLAHFNLHPNGWYNVVATAGLTALASWGTVSLAQRWRGTSWMFGKTINANRASSRLSIARTALPSLIAKVRHS